MITFRATVAGFGLLLGSASLQAAKTAPLTIDGRTFSARDAEGVDQMEHAAQAARGLFWRGRYAEAKALLDPLCAGAHNSTALYLRERAMCSLALEDFAAARRDLLDAATYAESVRVGELEKQALTLSGRESVKIYGGDPYEMSANYLLLALLFLRENDTDNALAACKSGILADSDASEGRYNSDFTILHLLEAKCLLLRGDTEGARAAFSAAEESHRTSHAVARELLTRRLDTLELLKLPAKQRKKLGKPEDDAVLQAELNTLDEQLAAATRTVDVAGELGPLLSGDYNALVLLPAEQIPRKTRTGKAGNFVVFDGVEAGEPAPALFVDGQPLNDGRLIVSTVADVKFQATTRGGRRMDGILAGQAAYRNTTIGVGDFFLEMSRQNNNDGGMLLLGTIIAVIGNSFNAEADTRCWQTLPAQYRLAALNLAPGVRKLDLNERRYFESRTLAALEVQPAPGRLAVAFAPNSTGTRFSEVAVSTSAARKRRFPPAGTPPEKMLAVPPPLGLSRIERIAVAGQPGPLAFSADPNRLMQQIERDIDALGVDAFQVVHAEIMQDPVLAARHAARALQSEVIKVQAEAGNLQVHCRFAVVACASGTVLAAGEYTGNATISNPSKADGNALFYEAFGAAWRQALTANLLQAAPSPASNVASATR